MRLRYATLKNEERSDQRTKEILDETFWDVIGFDPKQWPRIRLIYMDDDPSTH